MQFWNPSRCTRRTGAREVNIEDDPSAESIVIQANHGKRRVPTLKVGDRYFACSPFNAVQLAAELNVPLNPQN
jgi:glutaredoxin